jgi:hypothetical protein
MSVSGRLAGHFEGDSESIDTHRFSAYVLGVLENRSRGHSSVRIGHRPKSRDPIIYCMCLKNN